jgi:CHAD domain-containing protein
MADLRAGEPGTRAVLRLVRRETGKALEEMIAQWPPADEAIHSARKRLKKARAGLRLLRPALGARAFRRENHALRDAARPLSELRDARILIEALDTLARRAAPAHRKALGTLRERLETQRARARRRTLGSKRALAPVTRGLRRARRRVRKADPSPSGWSVLGRGVRRVYRAGREAFAVARRSPTVENLHEWRKQTKYLWHEIEMLHPIRPALMTRMADRAHRLSDRLGDDHDLAVLHRRISAARSGIPRAALAAVLATIERRRKTLQAAAFAIGRDVYAAPPRDWTGRLETHWRKWRATNGRGRRTQ